MEDFDSFLSSLKDKADLVEVLSTYTSVEKRGANYFACCPFHVEKTASMCVYLSTKRYYCYGCKATGDVFSLVQNMEKLSFMESVQFLANKYNMEVPSFAKNTDKQLSLKKQKDVLYRLMRETAFYYYNNLFSPKGQKGLDYLHNRGLDDDTITAFGMGYSLGYEELPKYLRSKGFKYEDMVAANVVIKRDGKESYFDPLAERVVVPILNGFNNVVALGGRVLEKKDNVGKYRNSGETIIFHKSNEVFGQHIIKKIPKLTNVIMVEGYMDVIALYQVGIHNVVASMGTALTENQAKLLTRYVKKVYLCYDGDEAGQTHIFKGVDILYEAGLEVNAVILPDNLDPDEYVRKYGKEAFLKLVHDSEDIFRYKIHTIEKKYDMTKEVDRGNFATEAVSSLKLIKNPAQLDPYISLIASISSIQNDIIYEQYKALGRDVNIINKFVEKKAKEKASDNYTKAMRFIMYALCGGIEGFVPDDEYFDCKKSNDMQTIYNIYRINGSNLTLEDLFELSSENEEVNNILQEGKNISEDKAQIYFKDCRKTVLTQDFDKKIQELSEQIDNETDDKARLIFTNQLTQLLNNKRKI